MADMNSTSQSKLKETGLFLLDILYNAAIIIILVILIRGFLISPFRVVGSSMADTLHNKEFILINKLGYIIGDIQRGDPIVFLPPIASRDNPKFEDTVQTDDEGRASIELSGLKTKKTTAYCGQALLSNFWFCTAKAQTNDEIFLAPQERQVGSSALETEWDQVKKIIVSANDLKEGRVKIEGEANTSYTYRIYDSKGSEYFVKRVIGIPGDTVKIEGGKVYVKKVNEQEFTEVPEDFLNAENKKDGTLMNTLRESNLYVVPEGQYFVLGDNRNHSSDSRYWLEPITQKESPFVPAQEITGKVFVVLWPFSDIRLIHSVKF